jgi:tetratricopeptide (TPR) repeat protein
MAMLYDSDNHIVKLCAEGMSLEGQGKNDEALQLFQLAWNESSNDQEKFTSAHYVARYQKRTEDKLYWDKLALDLAINMNDEKIKAAYPSLYLNVGKCYEDLLDCENAYKHYELAQSFINHLGNDGYGEMIKKGIQMGIERTHKE